MSERSDAPGDPRQPSHAPDDPTQSSHAPGDPWRSVELLYSWLDSNRAHDGRELLLLRLLKLQEEVGEVAEAVIGVTGSNPRKGTTHTWDDVRAELCDVIITAMVALRTLAPDARAVLAAHLAGVAERSLGARRG
ncbi:MazG-like family protein [Streptomyces neyagawaensis]|uniref:MazG-like family protein n=1 Tax=Streptomyces neyagawaensis TaxID=42238 RepID=UPI0006E44EBB|nr:MazG-like family protein [Streptomyces neyagawaensis]MCL6732676.1 MazG-like family protein [Streptomyces neyagawaensis]MDE1681554.1 MazG-like family protein [Streptomyces neyagawaensis]